MAETSFCFSQLPSKKHLDVWISTSDQNSVISFSETILIVKRKIPSWKELWYECTFSKKIIHRFNFNYFARVVKWKHFFHLHLKFWQGRMSNLNRNFPRRHLLVPSNYRLAGVINIFTPDLLMILWPLEILDYISRPDKIPRQNSFLKLHL